MAAKKGGAVALQQDVATDEEWAALLRRPGLLLVDVYSEWCGPCVGMLANLKKIKVELGGDLLVLATAKADNIEALHRHRNHSEPVWMLVSGGNLIDLIFGADAPRITRLIAIELNNEVKLQRGEECGRRYMDWDELTPEEQARLQRAEEKRVRALQEEEERLARQLIQMRADNYAQLAAKLCRYTVVLFLPHAAPAAPTAPPPAAAAAAGQQQEPEAEGGVLGALRDAWAAHGVEEVRRAHLLVTAEMAEEMFFERKLPQHEELIRALAAGSSLAILLLKRPAEVEVVTEPPAAAAVLEGAGEEAGGEAPAEAAEEQPDPLVETILVEPEMGEIEAVVAQSLYGFYPAQDPQQQQQQQQQQQEEGVGDAAEPEGLQWWRGEIQPAVDSPAAACVRAAAGAPALPGLWTPLSAVTKAAAMQTLFPADTLLLSRPPPPPSLLPPSTVHVFSAARCKEVITATSHFNGSVTGSGFFSEQRESLAVDEIGFESLSREKRDSDLFVVAVSNEATGALEALAALQPLAVSASAEEGAADCDTYFPGPAPPAE